MQDFLSSYIGQLRKSIGNTKLIVPGIRAIIRNSNGQILLIHRRDTNRWGMPSGSIELNESIFECLQREVKEETGLIVISAVPIAVYTHPRYSFKYPNGDEIKNFAFAFRVDEWNGQLLSSSDETKNAGFFSLNDLPDTHETYLETLKDLQDFDGSLILK